MLDLGASVNIHPLFAFEKLKLGSLQMTGTIMQLANHSTVPPKDVLEDVIVQVDNYFFLVIFKYWTWKFWMCQIKTQLFSKELF